jgi:hypothetical protein
VPRSCISRAKGGSSIPLHCATPDWLSAVRQQRTKFLLVWRTPATLAWLGLKRALVNRGDVEAHLVGPKGSDVLCGHAVAGTRWSGWLQRSRSRTSTGAGYGPRGANSRRSLTFFRTDERLCIVQGRFEEGGITCLIFVSVQAVGRHRRRRVCGGGFSAIAWC